MRYKKLVTAIIIFMVIAAGGTVLFFRLYYNTPLGFYMESERKNLNKYMTEINNTYNGIYDFYKPYFGESYETDSQIKLNTDQSFLPPIVKQYVKLVNNAGININCKNNFDKMKNIIRLSLLVGESPVIDIAAFISNNDLWLTVPLLIPDKYFYLDKKQMNRTYNVISERYGIEFIEPIKIFEPAGVVKRIYFPKKEIDKSIDEFGTFISEFISKDDVKYGKDLFYKTADKDIKVKEVIVTLTGSELNSLLSGLYSKILEDEKFYKLTLGNYESIIKYLDDTGILQLYKLMNKRGYTKLLEVANNPGLFKEKLLKTDILFSFTGDSVMKVLVDKHGNIMKRMITIPFEGPKKNRKVLIITAGKNQTGEKVLNNSFINVEIDKEEVSDEYNFSACSSPSNTNTYNMEFNNGTDSLSIDLKVKNTTDELTLNKNRIIDYDINMNKSNTDNTGRLNGTAEIIISENDKLKTRSTDTYLTVKSEFPIVSEEVETNVEIKNETHFEISDFDIPDVSKNEIIDLSKADEQKIKEVENEILMSFGMFYLKNKELLDSMMKK